MARTKLGPQALAMALALVCSGMATAQEETEGSSGFFSDWLPNFDISIGGFLRTESAFSTSSKDNPNNQRSNVFNGRSEARQAYVPPGYVPAVLDGVGLCGVLGAICALPQAAVSSWASVPFPTALAGDAASDGLRGTFSGNANGQLTGTPLKRIDNTFNYQILRGELETGIKFTENLGLIARVRGLYDPGVYKEFDASGFNDIITTGGGGINGGDPALYAGKPNYFEYRVEGGGRANPLEWTGRNYQVYFSALILDYNRGPINARIGNQQIAWGQALFFRVFDVVNGLDLRRHLVLDYAQEEYADERVPSLAARISWQFNEELLVDSFVEKFQPTIYPNPNTQYNAIPSQFTVHDLYKVGGYDDKLNYGLRFKGNYGQWGFQAAAVRRYNPDGVFRWTKSGVDRDLPCANVTTGNTLGCRVELTLQNYGQRSGALLAETAFEVAPGGVYSGAEWFNYAGQVRLDAIEGLNASITEFPATTQLFASPVQTVEEAYNELNTFFIAAGGSLRGHIAREYFRENVYSLGASYVVEGEPGSLLDQLIINVEHAYTQNRHFTNTTLSRNYPSKDTNVTALVMEKYYRFTQAFPATYFVYQYMHRDTDDLFGRLLSGYGGTETSASKGVKDANYHVLAFQQPFPQDIWRAGFALLVDQRGSLLVQPGIRWKYNSAFTVDAFYTHIEGALGGANPNDTLLSSVDYADEATLRLTYQF